MPFTVETSGSDHIVIFDEGDTVSAGGDLRVPGKASGEFDAVDHAVSLSASNPKTVVSVRDPRGNLVGSWRDGKPTR